MSLAVVRFWLAATVIVSALMTAQPLLHAQNTSGQARVADFKTFVQDIEENYAYIDRADKPWLTWEARFGPAARDAASKGAYNAVLAAALSELHDFHAEVRSPVPNRWLPAPTFADLWAEFQGGDAVITSVRAGSDAERAGVKVGDRVRSINSVPLADAIADRLTNAMDQAEPRGRNWALLSVLTGRAEQARMFMLQRGSRTLEVSLPVERHFDRAKEPISVTMLPGNVGLIRFNNSLGDNQTIDAVDKALEQMRHTSGLVLDLRDVPSGGNSSVALGVMGRFVRNTLPYQRHRIPNYGRPDVERDWLELVTPRGPFAYMAPVVVLVNRWTGSMGEGIAVGFDAMHRATVVGTRMAGLAGAVSDFRLPQTGVDVAFATEQLFHVNGTPRQDWVPPVLVVESGMFSTDEVLERGLKLLRSRAVERDKNRK